MKKVFIMGAMVVTIIGLSANNDASANGLGSWFKGAPKENKAVAQETAAVTDNDKAKSGTTVKAEDTKKGDDSKKGEAKKEDAAVVIDENGQPIRKDDAQKAGEKSPASEKKEGDASKSGAKEEKPGRI